MKYFKVNTNMGYCGTDEEYVISSEHPSVTVDMIQASVFDQLCEMLSAHVEELEDPTEEDLEAYTVEEW
jgi:hypothetical protein